jgi:hypothetical protein
MSGQPGNREIANSIAAALTEAVVKGRANPLQAAVANYRDKASTFRPEPDAPPLANARSTGTEPAKKHVDKRSPPRFIWGGIPFAPNGARYIAGNAGRNERYSNFSHLDPTIQRTVSDAAAFPRGPVFNFNSKMPFVPGKRKAGQRYPYHYEAHHLLPRAMFGQLLETTLKPYKDVVLKIDYDINNGRNIIMLPEGPEHTAVHRLPCHFTDHPNYTKKVESYLTDFANAVNEAAANASPEHPEITDQTLADKLHQIEDKCWTLVCQLGNHIHLNSRLASVNRLGLLRGKGGLG